MQPIVAPSRESAALEERKPFVGIRRKIAQKMQTAKNTAAHFTFVEECHSDDLIAMRERLRPAAAAQGVKLTFLPFIELFRRFSLDTLHVQMRQV